MPLTVRPMEEADIEPALRVQYAAFRVGELGKLLSPEPEPSLGFLEGSKKSRLEAMETNKAARFMVVDEDGTVIAAAHWDIYPEERTAEQVEKLCHKAAPPPTANQELWKDFFGHFGDARRSLGSKPIAVLHTLVTSPEHQGRGAGKLLLKKFTEEVDEAGLEGYLEASSVARPLYTKFGFQPDFEKHFDLTKYGGPKYTEINTVMLRPSKAAA